MAEDGKRIVIRVTEEEWRKFDNQRHTERTTFQKLGMRLFSEWLEAAKAGGDAPDKVVKKSGKIELGDKIHTFGLESVPEADIPWVKLLVNIFRGRNQVAVRALKNNIVAFADYSNSVPEATDGLIDILADFRRIASLEERLVDARKKSDVGPAAGPKKARGKPEKKAL